MNETFHWGIIGLGRIAQKFAADLSAIPDAKLVSVASRSKERSLAFAKTYGAEHAAAGYEAIFDGPRLDAIYVATPHVSHCELTIECLRRGVPVLCEKPLGMNLTEVERMIAVARAEGVYLMEALWTRFLPTTEKILELIAAGRIGTVEGVRADFGFRAYPDTPGRILDPALGGGSLLDIGIYPVFLAQLLLGRPADIQAMARLTDDHVDIDMGIHFRYAGGQLAHLHSTLLSRTPTEALIMGSEGLIHWHSRWHEPSSFVLFPPQGRPEPFHFDYPSTGYHYEALAVQADVRAGRKENTRWGLTDSRNLHRTLTDIRRLTGVRYPGE
jgi:predicted dehydrogenase